ncbi:MAG: hypothetical protein WC676_07950 [Candidatus Omnitrophota bacterium]
MIKTANYEPVLLGALKSAQANDYKGYDKFDALNSPFLQQLSFGNPWLRFILIQLVKESPFNIRPFLGVQTFRNPKGIALFARAYLFLYRKTKNEEYLKEAKILLDWLLENPSPGYKNLCWGYQFAWQDIPPFFQNKGEPNCVVTVFTGEALIHAFRETRDRKYLDAACSVARFLTEDLPVIYEKGEERAISYIAQPINLIVINIQVLSAAFLTKIFWHKQDQKILDIARKQLNFAYHRRTSYNAWYYTEPKGKSFIRHDNYHTGGILDGFLEYFEETKDERYMDVYWQGLDYYQKNLFEDNGAPRWMNDQKYPLDIHGAAQGIISFAKAGRYKKEYIVQAARIGEWTMNNLYRSRAQDFIYRQGRFFKCDFSLMRWCNAWMARALAEYVLADSDPVKKGI